jgi:hypothetical protein
LGVSAEPHPRVTFPRIAIRPSWDIEQGRFVERFGAAAAQLGDHDAAVRIAGVEELGRLQIGER